MNVLEDQRIHISLKGMVDIINEQQPKKFDFFGDDLSYDLNCPDESIEKEHFEHAAKAFLEIIREHRKCNHPMIFRFTFEDGKTGTYVLARPKSIKDDFADFLMQAGIEFAMAKASEYFTKGNADFEEILKGMVRNQEPNPNDN